MARKIVAPKSRRERRRSLLIRLGVALGVLVLGAGLFALISYLRISAVPPPPPEASLAPHAADAAAGPGVPLSTQLAAAEAAGEQGRHQSFVLNLRPVDVQATVAELLGGAAMQDFRVYLGEGTFVAQGKMGLRGRQLYATVRSRPRVEEGRLHMDILEAQMGTMPMPAAARVQIQQELERAITGTTARYGHVWLDSVSVSPVGVDIYGQTR